MRRSVRREENNAGGTRPLRAGAFIVSVGLVLAGGEADAQTWYDDFGDESVEDCMPHCWGFATDTWPGIHEVDDGRLTLRSVDGQVSQRGQIAGVAGSFARVSMRVRARSEGSGSVGVYVRATYVGRVDTEGVVVLHRFDGINLPVFELGAGEARDGDGEVIDASTDVMIQLDADGPEIELRVWRPGEPMPEEPTLSATDHTTASGSCGVAYSDREPGSRGSFAWAYCAGEPITADPLEADFSVSPQDGGAGESIAFDGTYSAVPGGREVTEILWNFGDGVTETGDLQTDHAYEVGGRFRVELTLAGSDGLVSRRTRTLTIACASEEIPPWSSADVGGNPLSGVTRSGDDELLFCSFGTLIDSAPHLFYQEVTGDAAVSGEVLDVERRQGGWIFREGLDPQDRYVAASLRRTLSGTHLHLRYRAVAGSPGSQTVLGTQDVPGWLRLERRGDDFVVLTSADGRNWEERGRRTLELPATLLAGVFTTGGNELRVRHLEMTTELEAIFRRGDCNDDGTVDISDASCTLNWLFLGGPAPGCVAVANANGDAGVDISDATYLLNHLFLGGPPLVAPFPGCGTGTLPADRANCETPRSCLQ